MNTVIDTHSEQGVAVYLDDMIIYAPSVQQQLQLSPSASPCPQALRAPHQVRVYCGHDRVPWPHCQLRLPGSPAPSHTGSRRVPSTDQPHSDTLLAWDVQLLQALRQWLCGHSSPSHLSDPQKDVPYDWTATQQQALKNLRAAVTTAPVLAIPDSALPFILRNDASAFAVGGVLLQAHPSGARPVAFASAKLSATQRRWPMYEKEAFAIFFCLQQWRHYLHGRATTVQTDHHSVAFLQSQTSLTAKQANWLQIIADNDIDRTFEYLPGKNNVVADALSRRPDLALAAVTAPQPDPTSRSHPAPAHPGPVSFLDPPPARRSQRPAAPRRHFADMTQTPLLPSEATTTPIRFSSPRACYPRPLTRQHRLFPLHVAYPRVPLHVAALRQRSRFLILDKNVQRELRPPHLSDPPLPPLPASPQGSVRAASHAAPTAPRSSAPSTTSSPNCPAQLMLLRWILTPRSIYHHLPSRRLRHHPPSRHHTLAPSQQLTSGSSSSDCQLCWSPWCRQDPHLHRQKLFLGPTSDHLSSPTSPVATITSASRQPTSPHLACCTPFQYQSALGSLSRMDFLGPLPLTAARHDMIVVVVCRLTKSLVIRPTITRATAEVIAAIFMSAVFADHGMPESIVSDRDTRFTYRF